MGLSICCTGTEERALHLKAQLLSLSTFKIPYPVEFIFADDSGTDTVERVLEDLTLPFPVTYIRYSTLHPWSNSPYGCPSFGLNLAIKHAKFDAILKVDPEIFWVESPFSLIPGLFHPDRVVIGHAFSLPKGDTQRILKGEPFEQLEGKIKETPTLFLFSKRRFLLVGGYDEDFMKGVGFETEEWLERMRLSGAQIVEFPKLRAFHLWHPLKRSFLLQHQNERLFQQRLKEFSQGKPWVANQDHVWGDPAAISKLRVFNEGTGSEWGQSGHPRECLQAVGQPRD